MRIPAQTGNSETQSGGNQFNKFACPDGASRQESALVPPRTVLDQMKSMPKSNKRRVITSDDEDDGAAVVAQSPKRRTSNNPTLNVDDTPSSVEWVQSRKASEMTQQEREMNIQKAVEHRKAHASSAKSSKSIPKATRPRLADDDSGDDGLDNDTPYAAKAALKRALDSGKAGKGGVYKSALLQEVLVDDQEDELEAMRKKRAEAVAAERQQRAESRTFMGRTFNTSPSGAPQPPKRVPSTGDGVQLQDIYAKGRSQLEAIELEDSDDEVVVVRRPPASTASSRSSATTAAKSSKSQSRDAGSSRRGGRRGVAESEDDNSDDGGNSRDSGDSGSEGGYGSDLNRSELQALANKVLQQCDALSRNLRQSLIQWETGADDASCAQAAKEAVRTSKHLAGSTAGAVQGQGGRDCVDLTSIHRPNSGSTGSSAAGSSQILYDEDIAQLCPELRLKGYQLVGVNWLKLLHQHNVNGVLADDMGLGKTIQTIAFLGWLASQQPLNQAGQRKPPRPHLLVVPASTMSNWELELRRFCPSFHVVTYHGSQNERAALRYEIRSQQRGCPDVILTTYTIFERESNKADRAFMQSLSLEYLVLDEAHGIKNAQSSRFVNLNMLKTRHRLLLSGTPVQNDIGELLSMLSFLMPQVFGRENRELLIEALSINTGASGATQQQSDLSLAQLRAMLAPFVLRRLKRDVLDQLTEKTTIVKRIVMTAFQKQVYDGILLGHAARKDMLQLKQRAGDEAEKILDDRMRSSRAPSSTALAGTETAAQGIVRPAPVDVTARPAASAAGSSEPECVSPFNKRLQRRDGVTPESRLAAKDRTVVSLLSEDTSVGKKGKLARGAGAGVAAGSDTDTASATSASSKLTSTTTAAVAAPTSLPSEIDLAAIAASTVNSADIDPESAASLDDATAATALQSLSASEASNLFTALRKAANHPLLLRVRYRDQKTLEKIAMITHSMGHFGNQCDYSRVRAEIDSMSDFDIHQLCLEYEALRSLQLDETALYDSPKMVLLRELLPQLQSEGHRVLVFSQWTRLLDLLEVLMQDISMRYLRLDGSTPVKTRQGFIDEFNTDTGIPVFLLSTKAGGLGINLTAADTVILHDLDFNPENDRQAEDRCHRIGQTRPVTVYKLFAEETVDEDIYEMGERKSKLSKAVLQDDRRRRQQQEESGAETAGSAGADKKRTGGKSGGGAAGAEEGREEEGSSAADISSILQKAMLRRVRALAAGDK